MTQTTAPSLKLLGQFVRKANMTTTLNPVEVPGGELNFNIELLTNNRTTVEDSELHAVSIRVMIEGELAEDSTPFFKGEFEVELVARIENMSEESLAHALQVYLPNQLMPYVRELVHSTTQRSGFRPIILPPVVFGTSEAGFLAETNSNPEPTIAPATTFPANVH